MTKLILMATVAYLTSSMYALPPQRASEEKAPQPIHDMSLCPVVRNTHTHMNERGEVGMGYSQTATGHHFLIQPAGGVIKVEAKSPDNTGERDNIRHHLAHIAQAFANAGFDIPMFVHDSTPPGAPEMKELRQKITYSFQETPAGGQVVIRTSDPRALAAIHKFLRYQIEEHQTGDPVTLPTP
jgi:hypothetical protein